MRRGRASKLGVAKAQLYGSRCRLIDLGWQEGRTGEDLSKERAETRERIAEAAAEVVALGGDPDECWPRHGIYANHAEPGE